MIAPLALLLWWWGSAPAPTLLFFYGPADAHCAIVNECTATEIENAWILRQPETIPNTWVSMPPDEADPDTPDGYRRQLAVPDTIPPGYLMWWGEP
jgi:hypothetical protein